MSPVARPSAARERLLAAAADTIAVRGYHASGVTDMLTAAEVPSGVLYHHFGSKEDLAVAAITRVGTDVLAAFEVALDGPGGVRQRTSAVISAWEDRLLASDFAEGCPIATTALETAGSHPALQRAAAAAYESWLARLAGGLVEEGRDPEEARDLAVAVLVLIEGALLLAQALRSVEPMRAADRTLAALLPDAASS